MSIYLGSKIFNGTEVFGKIMKLLSGNTGIFLGRLFNCINSIILNKLFKTMIISIFFKKIYD
tara:strand:+ start:330 stop:515 length:186 start_codon:yes stop_codon:yes gene_type:complete